MRSLDINGLTIEWLGHDCFKIKNKIIVYFDPFRIPENLEKANLILITHEHFDHCSIEDLLKIVDKNTIVVAANICRKSDLPNIENRVKKIIYMKPGSTLTIDDIKIETIPAYNVNKFRSPGVPFHPKGESRVGFILTYEGKRIYHAGDTDHISEMKNLSNIDIALLPVSGTYVMTPEEAAEAVKDINPKLAIPMHFNSIVGSTVDAMRFRELSEKFTRVEILE
jgi:L-ascorbate metabolism protein UlaG (beta-lactamase superfamily)